MKMLKIKHNKQKQRLYQVIKDHPTLSSVELGKTGFASTTIARYYIAARRRLKIKPNKMN